MSFFQSETQYYVVMPDAPAISQKARDLGTILTGYPQIRIYAFGSAKHYSYSIIAYEVTKYRIACGELGPEHSLTLRVMESLGMDDCPEYFGECPTPTQTPWGEVIQHQKIWNGLYLVETERFGWALAVCYSLCLDIGADTYKHAKLENGKHSPNDQYDFGYRFYSMKNSCIPIYELLSSGGKGGRPWMSKICIPALKNAIWEYYPQYARRYNRKWRRWAVKTGKIECYKSDMSRIKGGADFT